jgi:serine/threonine protein kinase
MPDSHPSMLGEYALIELIGRGGMGEVWRAERAANAGVRRRAAVKRILPQFQRDPVLRERFLAEARTTARLEHPNIVQVLDFGDVPEPYLVLEYVEGISVGDLLKHASLGHCALPVAAALFIVAEAADALDYAHRRTDDAQRPLGIVHRDVSPPNILLSFDGAVKVNDFGVARAADNIVRTQAGLSVGKIVYSSPEQARGEAVDRRADVFSLGIVLWELLTLRPLVPRNQPPAMVLEALRTCDFPPASRVQPGVAPEIDAIVRDALAATPANRTANAGRLSKALRVALSTIAPGFDQRELARIVRAASPERAARAATEVGSAGGGASGSALSPQRMSRPPGAATMMHGSPMPRARVASQIPADAIERVSPTVAAGPLVAPNPARLSSPPAARDSIPRTAEHPANPAFAPYQPQDPRVAPSRPPGAAPTSPSPPQFGPPIAATRVAPAAPRSKPSRRAIVIAAALLAIVAAVIAAVAWYYAGDPDEEGPWTPSSSCAPSREGHESSASSRRRVLSTIAVASSASIPNASASNPNTSRSSSFT